MNPLPMRVELLARQTRLATYISNDLYTLLLHNSFPSLFLVNCSKPAHQFAPAVPVSVSVSVLNVVVVNKHTVNNRDGNKTQNYPLFFLSLSLVLSQKKEFSNQIRHLTTTTLVFIPFPLYARRPPPTIMWAGGRVGMLASKCVVYPAIFPR